MKRTVAGLGAVAAGFLSLGVLAGPAIAFTEAPAVEAADVTVPTIPGSGTIGTLTEAWYNLPFSCDLPTGCLPVPNLLPDGTLHVGVIAGLTTALSTIKLDTTKLPKGATITEGELSLPVDTALTSLSLQPETAGFKACLLTQDFTGGEGLTVKPPKSDCGVSNPATYVKTPKPHFVIDLQPFADAWASGTTNYGVSLEPFTTAKSDHATWQVALASNGAAESLGKITAALKFVHAAADGTAVSPSPSASASASESPAATTTDDSSAAPVSAPVAQNPAPQVAAPTTTKTSNTAGFAGKGYAYPVVWLLPVALLAGCVWVGRLLTKSLDPAT